jgi:hypothetical protein
MISLRRTLTAAALCIAATATVPVAQQAPGNRLVGFSAAALRTEREAESRFMAGVSTDAMSAFHRSVTRRPLYGWNIYSLYEGQPLPGLAEAIRLRDRQAVNREVARIEAALTRLLAALGRIVVS